MVIDLIEIIIRELAGKEGIPGRPSPTAWAWACPSPARSSKLIGAGPSVRGSCRYQVRRLQCGARCKVGVTSSKASWLCAVPLFVSGGRSFVPTCGRGGAPRTATVKVGRCAALPLAPALPGHALRGPSTARGLSGSVRCFISLDALEGAPLMKNRRLH